MQRRSCAQASASATSSADPSARTMLPVAAATCALPTMGAIAASTAARCVHDYADGRFAPGGQNASAYDRILSVRSSLPLSVQDAAARLGVSAVAVRQQISAGRLPAVKAGRDWRIDARAVERAARQRPGSGRPLSAAMAWAVLLLASGDSDAAGNAAGIPRYRSRAKAWLQDHPLADHAPRLRARAVAEEFDAHPSELPRLAGRRDLLPSGISAGDIVGLAGGPDAIEAYAPASHRDDLVAEHALHPGPGPVLLRWVADELWPLLDREGRHQAPHAAVLVDLLEHDDPRARREAARALAT